MAFEGLTEKLQETFKKLRGKGKLSEKDVKSALREVRMALLQADVNFKVVKNFIKSVQEKAVGSGVLDSITPGQQVIKIVHEEMINLMGGQVSKLNLTGKTPQVIMLVGLQGAGKTTTAGKLANILRKNNRQVLLVGCDIYRPAAVQQLKVLGQQLNIDVFSQTGASAVEIAQAAQAYAIAHAQDVMIIDTAGRLHIDDTLMQELIDIKEQVTPCETLLVVDAMTGQDAVNVATSFNEQIGVTGIIMTKLDSDSRGGAALSIKAVTGKPIKYVATGEKLNALEAFHPDRMASRILGMGDILSLIEKAQNSLDEEKARKLEERIKKEKFTFEDFLEQMDQVRNMGPLDQVLGMLPGMNNKALKNMQVDEKELKHIEAIIQSMTPEERRKPELINGSRRKRIAAGSGTNVQEINRLLKQFYQTRKMLRQFSDMGKGGKLNKFKLPFMQ